MHTERSKFREGEVDFLLPPAAVLQIQEWRISEGANLHKKTSRFFIGLNRKTNKHKLKSQQKQSFLPRGKARTRIQSLQCKFEKEK
jgi:hypothetical protein